MKNENILIIEAGRAEKHYWADLRRYREQYNSMRFLFPQKIKYFLEVAGFRNIEFCPFLKAGKPPTEQDWNMAVIAEA